MAENPLTLVAPPAEQAGLAPLVESTRAASPAATGGPLERAMDPFMRKALESLTPEKYKSKLVNHYNNNKLVYDLSALALGGLGVSAVTASIKNAFKRKPTKQVDAPDDDEYEYVIKRRRRNSGSDWSNTLTWLLPLALLAGGGYAWNKYGDTVKRTVSNVQDFNKDYETWKKFKTKVDNKLTSNKVTNWLYTKAKNWVNS